MIVALDVQQLLADVDAYGMAAAAAARAVDLDDIGRNTAAALAYREAIEAQLRASEEMAGHPPLMKPVAPDQIGAEVVRARRARDRWARRLAWLESLTVASRPGAR